MLTSDLACAQAGRLHANMINDTAVLFTNFAQKNPMNSIRIDRDLTVTLVPYSDYPRARLIGIDCDDQPAVSQLAEYFYKRLILN